MNIFVEILKFNNIILAVLLALKYSGVASMTTYDVFLPSLIVIPSVIVVGVLFNNIRG